MDGNDSLKRIQRRKPAPTDPGDGDTPVIRDPNERKDERTVGADYYISREEVNRWSREFVLEWLKEHENDSEMVSIFIYFKELL